LKKVFDILLHCII